MAQTQTSSITGSFTLGNNEFTGSAGAIWYDTVESVLKYSYLSGSVVIIEYR